MKKILSIFLSFLILISPCFAMDQMFITGTDNTALNDTTSRYFIPTAADKAGSSTNTVGDMVVAATGTISNLYVELSAAPDNGGGTQRYRFIAGINGSTGTLTCDVDEGATTCSDIAHTASVTAGDTIRIVATPSGTPTVSIAKVSLKYSSDSSSVTSIYSGNTPTNLSTTVTHYISILTSHASGTSEFSKQMVMPIAGTIKNLYVVLSGSAGVGSDYVFTMRKNGSDQTVTCTAAEPATTCNDVSNSFSVSVGDLISIKSVPNSGTAPTARTARVGFALDASTAGKFIIGSSNSLPSASVTNYGYLTGAQTAYNDTATNTSAYIGESIYVTDIAVKIGIAPDNGGGTQTRTSTLYNITGTSALAPTCTVSEAETTCAASGFTQIMTATNSFAIESTVSGTPAASDNLISFGATYTSPRKKVIVVN